MKTLNFWEKLFTVTALIVIIVGAYCTSGIVIGLGMLLLIMSELQTIQLNQLRGQIVVVLLANPEGELMSVSIPVTPTSKQRAILSGKSQENKEDV